ncbi:phage holin [Adlercreutzia sp. ZJ242]|uniref:phage holin n=1 Tax=Adlercreutzia sp. ZJ242 TaxID=2709409 RepID=UPI0013ED02CC|nr:phage holin [Adlercreutzia sp. ZJ242]
MNINWKARIKNKVFWLAIIPALFLFVEQVAGIGGVTLDLTALQDQIVAAVGTVFAILTILGVVIDPTTEGLGDSLQAMSYKRPKTLEEQIKG